MKNPSRGWKLVVAVCLFAVLGGCGQKDGEPYLGKWGSQKREGLVEITRNGERFVFADTHPNAVSGAMTTEKVPASYHDGALWLSTSFGPMKVGYDQSHDTLLVPTIGGSMALSRIKQ